VVPRVQFEEIEGGRCNRTFEVKLLCVLPSTEIDVGEVAEGSIEDKMCPSYSVRS